MSDSGTLPLQPLAGRAEVDASAAPELGIALLTGAAAAVVLLLGSGLMVEPGSGTGIAVGALGLLLMLGGSAGYAWRKRHAGPGPLQVWLQAHAVSGMVGPALILLHSGFAFRGLAGVATALMLVVAGSGAAGRYGYPAAVGKRTIVARWWLLHVPFAYALFALALVHAGVALYLTLAS